jgi:nitrite reductase/ring-hydroxylating ferredoxin subunit
MARRLACRVSDLPPGTSMTIPGEVAIALFRTQDGEFFGTADLCTHEEWSLGTDSDLEGDEVTCPLHMARYNVRTGKVLCFPAMSDLRTFEVQVEGDEVYVID